MPLHYKFQKTHIPDPRKIFTFILQAYFDKKMYNFLNEEIRHEAVFMAEKPSFQADVLQKDTVSLSGKKLSRK
ncbi:hypothetical protein CSB45_08510 [candidate division KSB3 bacterium]|uniref:Uncharacterized protein n=1 Tax=candidate division KSB3 bacterium TaxID=2044937 RepID=A0A2G6E649_9BACT|nr:MAG: hypothetical protein CSB45_08510 [candidate division KSB3 bacterium]PIE29740.1 MAG: hypothetical protein CSA57_06705 [candidate division KSB3 bacterium]